MGPLTHPAHRPCGSCPYRRDVPSGIWAPEEYDKLLRYDGPTWDQDPALFLCHQRDGSVCGGWLACHDPQELLAVRLAAMRDEIGPDVWFYKTDVPVFASGAEARDHGLRDLDAPGSDARRLQFGIMKARAKAGDD